MQFTTVRQAIGISLPYEQERPGFEQAPLGCVAGQSRELPPPAPLLLELVVPELELLEAVLLAPPAPLAGVEVTDPPQLIAATASAAKPKSTCSFFRVVEVMKRTLTQFGPSEENQ